MESIWASWKGVSEVESLSLRAGKPRAFVASLSGKSAKWTAGLTAAGGAHLGAIHWIRRGIAFSSYKNVQIETRSGMLRNTGNTWAGNRPNAAGSSFEFCTLFAPIYRHPAKPASIAQPRSACDAFSTVHRAPVRSQGDAPKLGQSLIEAPPLHPSINPALRGTEGRAT
jgi:hypothetical protein